MSYYIYCEHKDEMRQSASALYSEVLTNRDLGIALFIKCLVKGSLENEGLSFFCSFVCVMTLYEKLKKFFIFIRSTPCHTKETFLN